MHSRQLASVRVHETPLGVELCNITPHLEGFPHAANLRMDSRSPCASVARPTKEKGFAHVCAYERECLRMKESPLGVELCNITPHLEVFLHAANLRVDSCSARVRGRTGRAESGGNASSSVVA